LRGHGGRCVSRNGRGERWETWSSRPSKRVILPGPLSCSRSMVYRRGSAETAPLSGRSTTFFSNSGPGRSSSGRRDRARLSGPADVAQSDAQDRRSGRRAAAHPSGPESPGGAGGCDRDVGSRPSAEGGRAPGRIPPPALWWTPSKGCYRLRLDSSAAPARCRRQRSTSRSRRRAWSSSRALRSSSGWRCCSPATTWGDCDLQQPAHGHVRRPDRRDGSHSGRREVSASALCLRGA